MQTLILPSPTTPEADVADAIAVAETLAVRYNVIQLEPMLTAIKTASSDFMHEHAAANLQSRLRMLLLYGRANAIDGRVVGTGNRSELLTGYFTKYGDGGVDLLPIGHLYKTEVWQLATELGVPQHLIDKAPSAGLHHGQTDEADLGMTYQQLDEMFMALDTATSLTNVDAMTIERIKKLKLGSAHKRAMPPTLERL